MICDIGENYGLWFFGGSAFYDNFMNINDNDINEITKDTFNSLGEKYEMNGGKKQFNCKELGILKLL